MLVVDIQDLENVLDIGDVNYGLKRDFSPLFGYLLFCVLDVP